MKIGINTGHFGTVGAEGYLSEIGCNTAIAAHLVPLLKAAGHKALEINDAAAPDYISATKMANRHSLDLLISIHCNSSINESAEGTEVLYFEGNGKTGELARKMSAEISAAIGTKDRGAVPRRDLYILKNTTAPAILVESFFVSNKADCRKYNAQKIASAICRAVGQAENKYSYDKTVDNMIKDGITTKENMTYWEKALSGRAEFKAEYVRAVLDRYHEKCTGQ